MTRELTLAAITDARDAERASCNSRGRESARLQKIEALDLGPDQPIVGHLIHCDFKSLRESGKR